ncbi:MAG: UDP-3-O-(3-hydroxymyristoyl)glucosamine N-acyltransferase [Candidatus Hodarchaeota archaeon]
MKVNKITVHEIISLLGEDNCNLIGDIQRIVHKAAPITEAEETDLVFCSYQGEKAVNLLNHTKSKVIICEPDFPLDQINDKSKTLILISGARLNFIRCLTAFFSPPKKKGIHKTAIIGEDCIIGKDVYIGAKAVIENKVKIGDRCQIYPGVIIHEDIEIGKDVTIFPNSVIGSDGFSHIYNEKGILEKFPQLGTVRIEDHVEVGANCCIDRGSLTTTLIGEGTKFDNLVHVAHNVKIGKYCFIVAQVFIGGSVIIEDNVWIAAMACLRDNVKIGKNATIGMGAIVTKDVADEKVVIGNPARVIDSNFKGGRLF